MHFQFRSYLVLDPSAPCVHTGVLSVSLAGSVGGVTGYNLENFGRRVAQSRSHGENQILLQRQLEPARTSRAGCTRHAKLGRTPAYCLPDAFSACSYPGTSHQIYFLVLVRPYDKENSSTSVDGDAPLRQA